MASGMGVDDNVVAEFTNLKLKKTAKIITFKIDEPLIKIADRVGPNGTVADLKSKLPKDECRYAVYDADKKIHFIMWTPEAAKVKDKMVYSSSKDALHKQLEGVTPVAVCVHDHDDIDEKIVECPSLT